jgi:hypothetical protein
LGETHQVNGHVARNNKKTDVALACRRLQQKKLMLRSPAEDWQDTLV